MNKNDPNRKQLDEELQAIGMSYIESVDEGIASNQSPADVYHKKTGHSLISKIQETFENNEYVEQFPKTMQTNMSKTYSLVAYQLSSYERFKNNNFSKSTEVWQEDSNLSTEKKVHKAVGFSLYKTDIIAEHFKNLNKKNEHIRDLSKFSDLKFGDVIQIYQPYDDNHTKNNTKNNIDRYGQNRFYGVLQKLPNGDVLAVDFRGHRNQSIDSDKLKYDPTYAYPSSKNVSPSLDIGDRLLVQLPKEAIVQGTALREKYEAASYGKPYDNMAPLKIRIYEMSPENVKKMENFKGRINQNGLDIGWSKNKEKVVPASPKGRRMFNEVFNDNIHYHIKSGTYNKRNALMTQRINRQALIRETKYGETSTKKIQTKAQREHIFIEHTKNDARRQSTKEDLSR